jgi:hypothetical protein
MRLSWSSIADKLIDAVSTGCSVYLFSNLILLPFLLTMGLPISPELIANTSLLFGSITSLGLFSFGVVEAVEEKRTQALELQHHKDVVERNEELFAKLSARFALLRQRRETHLNLRRNDFGSAVESGLAQATNTWAISAAILIPWLALPPLAATSLIISSALALSVGIYYATLKSADLRTEQQLEFENQVALSEYQEALSLKSRALKPLPEKHSRFKRAVLQVIRNRRDSDSGLQDAVKILSEYNLANYWQRKKTLAIAFIMGGITGSSVAEILTTFVCISFALSPAGWASNLFLLLGALWMGYNNYKVCNDKLERERNKALTNIYREKTQTLLQEIATSLKDTPSSSSSKMLRTLGRGERPASIDLLGEDSSFTSLFKDQPVSGYAEQFSNSASPSMD